MLIHWKHTYWVPTVCQALCWVPGIPGKVSVCDLQAVTVWWGLKSTNSCSRVRSFCQWSCDKAEENRKCVWRSPRKLYRGNSISSVAWGRGVGLPGGQPGESISSRENIMCKGSGMGLSIACSGTRDSWVLRECKLWEIGGGGGRNVATDEATLVRRNRRMKSLSCHVGSLDFILKGWGATAVLGMRQWQNHSPLWKMDWESP